MKRALIALLLAAACGHEELGVPRYDPEKPFTGTDEGLDYCRSVCYGSNDVRLWWSKEGANGGLTCMCYCPRGSDQVLSFSAVQMKRKDAEAAWRNYILTDKCGGL